MKDNYVRSQHQWKMLEEQVRGDFYKFKSLNAAEPPAHVQIFSFFSNGPLSAPSMSLKP